MFLKVLLTAIITGTIGITLTVPYGVDVAEVEVAIVTQTPSPSPTHTPTHTSSPTRTGTATSPPPTVTSTPSHTGTFTPVPTVTATATPTPTATPTDVVGAVCNVVIQASQRTFDGRNVLPGQTICFAAGTRDQMDLYNLQGTASAPIRIIPQNGVVTFLGSPTEIRRMIRIYDSRHVHMSGKAAGDQCGTYLVNGMPVPYEIQRCGFRVLGGGIGIRADDGVSDLEFSYIEVGRSNLDTLFGSGFLIRNMDGSPFMNLRMHHNYVHHTANECIYISFAVNQGPSPFRWVWVTYNYLTECGWGSLNFKQVTDGEGAYNYIRAVGVANEISNGHGNGIDLVRVDRLWLHHNDVLTTAEECIKSLSLLKDTEITVDNNHLGGCGSRRTVPALRHHVRMTYTDVKANVRNNVLVQPGLGLDVRGTGEVTGNVSISGDPVVNSAVLLDLWPDFGYQILPPDNSDEEVPDYRR